MSKDNNDTKKISDLEHEVLEGKISGTKAQIMALGDTLHNRINDLEKRSNIQFKNIADVLHEIKDTGKETLKQAKQTNGRVNQLESEKLPEKIKNLEKDTKVIRFMHKYPVITIIVALGMYLFTIEEFRDTTIGILNTGFEWLFKFIM